MKPLSTGDCHGTLGHDLRAGQFDILHQTHSVGDGLVQGPAAFIGDIRGHDNHRIRMTLDDLTSGQRDGTVLLQKGVQTDQNTGLHDDCGLR